MRTLKHKDSRTHSYSAEELNSNPDPNFLMHLSHDCFPSEASIFILTPAALAPAQSRWGWEEGSPSLAP
jgi:hypothetical protein